MRHFRKDIDMALYCVVFACSQVPLMGKIANNSRPIAKSPMTSPSIHGGARSAPPCIEAVLMGNFAMGCKWFAKLPMSDAWLRANITQHDAICIPIFANFDFLQIVRDLQPGVGVILLSLLAWLRRSFHGVLASNRPIFLKILTNDVKRHTSRFCAFLQDLLVY